MSYLTNTEAGTNQWWKYFLVFLASVFGGQIVGAIPLFVVILVKMQQSPEPLSANIENMADLSAFGIDPNLGLALMIVPFLVSLLVLFLLLKPLHNRNYKTLFSGSGYIRWKRFFVAALIWFGLMAIYLIISYSVNKENFTLNFELNKFLPLILVTILLIPIQSSYEEIMFRGYLAQGVAAWTKSRIAVILFPALIFGMLHVLNPEVSKYGFWLVMPQYVLFGIIFGLISVLDDGIELAMGAHSANNVFLSLFVTTKASALQTPALLVQEHVDALNDLLIMAVLGVVFIIIISKIYRFRYNLLTKKLVFQNDDSMN